MSAPVVLLFPGASLMDITTTSTGVRVRCPGCKQVQNMTAIDGAIQTAAFVHDDDCQIYKRIQTATRAYERQFVRRG